MLRSAMRWITIGDMSHTRRGTSALLWLLLAVSPAAGQFSAQPVILELRTDDAAARSGFVVRNESSAPLQLRIYGGDYDQPEDGGHVFMEAGEHPSSCDARLRFYPDLLALPAGGTGRVDVFMEPDVSTCWSLIFIESSTRAPTGMQVAQRIGVKVYGVSGHARAEAEIRSARVDVDAAGLRQLRLEFQNAGSRPLRSSGEVEIRSETGGVVAVVPVAAFSTLPGRVARLSVPLQPTLGSGRYLAIPILDFGGDYLAGGQVVFRVEAD
jgi:hypothetical protein